MSFFGENQSTVAEMAVFIRLEESGPALTIQFNFRAIHPLYFFVSVVNTLFKWERYRLGCFFHVTNSIPI